MARRGAVEGWHGVLAAVLILLTAGAWAARQSGPPAPPADPQPTARGSQEKKDPPQENVPLPPGKKLILKDGSYHLVRSYERKGDRVRFYSIERSTWEEVPADLVDWEATRKAEAEQARRNEELVEKTKATQAAERTAELDVDASIEVVPGIFLPEGDGVYLIAGRTILPLAQAAADVKLDKGRLLTQVLVPVPVVPSRHRVQIAGARAQLRVSPEEREFYMRTADAREPNMELIRAQVKGNVRQIEFISTNVVGQKSTKREAISIQSWQVAKGVYRFTLSQALEPGEYVLAEVLAEGMNLNVWDFGVDPAGTKPRGAGNRSRPAPQNPPGKATQKP